MKPIISLSIALLVLFSLVACGGGGGSASGTTTGGNAAVITSTITGSAVKGPIEGARIQLYYFDATGNDVEILAANAPVETDASGAFSFRVEGRDLMGIASPLLIRTDGGTMTGGAAPTLAAIIADPMPLTFAQVTLDCYLSVPSSVAAGLLERLADSTGRTPGIEDARQFMARVENQLNVDLTADPADGNTTLAMFNQSMDQVLHLLDTPTNNPAVDEFIAYLIANLSSASGELDGNMDDPLSPGSDVPAVFTPFFTVLAGEVGIPANFLILRLESDAAFIENDGSDAAFITATLTDATGQPAADIDQVLLGLSSGDGSMTLQGYDHAQGQVEADLKSLTAGANVIQAEYELAEGYTITEQITVTVVDLVIDSDGDGFADGQEQMGWEIIVDTLGYGSDGEGYLLTKRLVTSDPSLGDTDGDGLDDYAEYLAGSDPRLMDTDGDGLTDCDELNRWHSSPTSVDTDGDARGPDRNLVPMSPLFDGNELALLSTSPTLADTDGDGRTDYEEYDHPTRSPLVSDLPGLEMEIVDAVDVRLDVTYAEETGTSFEYGSELMKSRTTTTSEYEEHSLNIGVEVGYEFKVGLFPEGSVSTKLSFDQGNKWSTTRTSSETAQTSHSEYTTDSRTRTETAATGSMSAGIRLSNPGDITYTLSKLGITVRHWEMGWDEGQGQMVKSFQTLATLVPSLGGGITLAPGEETPVLQVAATELNTDRVKELLRRPDSLYLEAGYFELENAEQVNFDFLKEINVARTASIIIDPGQSNAEEYRVATNVQRGPGGTYPGISLGEILTDILQLEYTTIARRYLEPASPTDEQVLFSMNGLETGLADPHRGFWVAVHESEHPSYGLSDFDDVPVRAGDRVLLIYVRDDDGDGLNSIEEQHYGTYVSDGSDYDGDGLTDYDEVRVGWQVEWTDAKASPHSYQVFSSPTSADQDGDGLNDLEEKNAGTNPSNPDTDCDGIIDSEDTWPLYQARVIFVDQSATGSNDGSSWPDAFIDLQAALAAAQAGYDSVAINNDDVSEIWVADGVYKPHGGDVGFSFNLVNTVGVYGGFHGIEGDYPGEIKRSQRDRNPQTNSTVLSGDLNDDDMNEDYGDNTCHIVKAGSDIDKPTALEGFVITGGNAPSTQPDGGGMMLEGPGAMLNHLFFYNNHSASGGGAIRVKTNGVTISNCTFSENDSSEGHGGAIYVDQDKDVSIENCFFRGNSVYKAHGGAIYAGSHTRLTIKDTDVIENSAEGASDSYTSGGGAWIGDNSTVLIENSRFIGNSARYRGGGLYVDVQSDLQVVQSVFDGNTTIGNYNYSGGGGIFSYHDGRVAIVNSTIINNATYDGGSAIDEPRGGGIRLENRVLLRVDNSIFWGNRADTAYPTWIANQIEGTQSLWTINTSCIEHYDRDYLTISGYGNIWEDPELSETRTPQSGSPVIDTGNIFVDFEPLTVGFQILPEFDLAKELRLVDGDENGLADVDMGAYEYQGN